jgi:hypothetical protein
VVSDVNRLLAHDVADSGGFMTLFFLSIDRLNRKLSWVRAGHDPAVFYDPRIGTVEELRGSGMAMGIDGDHDYEQFTREDLAPGQIILLGTDGIWEAQNLKDGILECWVWRNEIYYHMKGHDQEISWGYYPLFIPIIPTFHYSSIPPVTILQTSPLLVKSNRAI